MKDTLSEIIDIMPQSDYIRNMSIIAHVDHGKTTLSDSFLARAGVLSQKKAGKECSMMDMEQERARGITIRSANTTLFYTLKDNKKMLLNLIDSPGHVDFSSEVTAALRVTDGALVIVDTVDGVCVSTERVLRQACQERVKSCLLINKVDRAISELQQSSEDMYQSFVQTIEKVNICLSSHYSDEEYDANKIDVMKNNIAFGAGKECWAFRVSDFAKIYCAKWKQSEEKTLEKLWGDNFFDPVTKKFSRNEVTQDNRTLKRAFCQFIIDPIINIYKLIIDKEEAAILFMEQVGVKLTNEEKQLKGRELRKTLMRKWLNAADNLLEMIYEKLPSPKEAQQYRSEILYTGPQDDIVAQSIKNCDPKGPLIIYVSKMYPNKDYEKFYAFGRVFSGTVEQGQKVIVLGPEYQVGEKQDYFPNKSVSQAALMINKKFETISTIQCGNVCFLSGLDDIITKTATITNNEQSFPLKALKFAVAPVVRQAVSPVKPADQVKLLNALKKLQKCDPLVLVSIDNETGENIISGSGELHLGVCQKLLQDELVGKIDLKFSDPLVKYNETVSPQVQGDNLFVKSKNKHNKLWGYGQDISNEMVTYIEEESEKGYLKINSLDFQDKLVNEFQWQREDTKRIWCFAPQLSKTNVLVDGCSQVQGLQFIKDNIVQGFEQFSYEGVLINEQMRGYRFNLKDAVIHGDNAHRGGDQIIPMARRLFQAGQLSCQPQILEPIFSSEIYVTTKEKQKVYNLLNRRRAQVHEEEQIDSNHCIIRAWLPVAESFGFSDELRRETNTQASDQCVFSRYQIMPGDPLQAGSKSNIVVNNVRKQKGLKQEIPNLSDLIDKN